MVEARVALESLDNKGDDSNESDLLCTLLSKYGKECHISISYVSELDLIQNESRIRFVVPTTIVLRYNPDKGGFSSPAGTTSKYAQTALYTIEFKCRVEKKQCVWKHTQLDRDIQADIELSKNHLNIIVAVEPDAVIALFTLASVNRFSIVSYF
ncbi:unnamed protein product [Rotaria magnacalcarata]